MKRITFLLAAALCNALAVEIVHAAPPPPNMPNPARCPATPAIETDTNERKGPLAVPPQFSGVARSGRTSLAIATLAGGTFCHDIHTISEARNFALTADKRFFSFDWYGYEEGGHFVIDRSGRGLAVDTGATPMFSPSRQLLAAVEFSESGFGSLNGFAVWRVETSGLRRIAMLEVPQAMAEWRLDGWTGDNCVRLSAIPNSRMPEDNANVARTPRDRFIARPGARAWAITRAPQGGCPAR